MKGLFGSPENNKPLSRRADDKKGKKKKKKPEESYANMPEEYLCQLTRKPMSEPVKTIYGNVYDKAAILKWLSMQGKICPLTGGPLSEVDLTPIEGLGDEIREWILKESSKPNEEVAAVATASPPKVQTSGHSLSPVKEKETKTSDANDDLYDF